MTHAKLFSAAIAVLAMAASPTHAQTIFRCKDASGQVSFQHQPCADSMPQQTAPSRTAAAPPPAQPRSQPIPPPPGLRPPPAVPALGPPMPPTRIQFGQNPKDDYARAASWLDSIRSLGGNCRSALTTGADGAGLSCRRFLDKLAPGAEYEQVGWRLKILEADESAARLYGRYQMPAIKRAMDEIGLHKEFVQATLGPAAKN